MADPSPRLATPADAVIVARLLDAFNREFHAPTPGPEVLAARLRRLLAGADVIAVDGADTDARRFYERHGYTDTQAGQDQPSFYYHRAI
jgi:hypothetical protein